MSNIIEFVPILQTAIGPVILISGVGLLLLTMTNRLGRAIDRARRLAAEPAENVHRVQAQLSILWVRARLLRLAILLASTSALGAGLLVILLFLAFLMRVEWAWLVSALFIASMAALIGSLVVFIADVNRSLAALRLELESHKLHDA
ncbi:MAG TPA: DUF2721 domain-containing protein [Candidatus Binatia bacterium]